ncbi:MAG: aminotransferase class I/II-fold pyridoxal phosphate-dependent enzyme [Candidatus Lokiarchaeota archaeon]|nr:aminotransferase class I/II-fold pyridoxal phosphate-dependent enzyme [Candidatus Lokiarchaeota archaeon]
MKRKKKKSFPISSKVNLARYTKSEGIYPYFIPLSTAVGPRVVMNNRQTIMLGSNNYLGLANHPEMIKAAIKAIQTYGTGCTGSRFLNGTLDLHVKLEKELAAFMGKEGAICFSTGMQANLGVISGITSKNDLIISDEKNHGSIIDACRLSYANTVVYNHDNMESLERCLRATPKSKSKWIISDGVFSMEGSLAQIDVIVELAEKYDARVIIDDAHGVGHMGHHGEGSVGHFNLMDKVDLVVGTFSKSFASIGGFVVGDRELIEHLSHHARSLIFSAAIPPSAAAIALKALEIFYTADDLRTQLRKNTARFRKGVEISGFHTISGITPVVPIIIGDVMKMLRFNRDLLDAGVYVNPVVPPAVPKATVRTSLMATHTEEDLDEAVQILEYVAKKNRILK